MSLKVVLKTDFLKKSEKWEYQIQESTNLIIAVKNLFLNANLGKNSGTLNQALNFLTGIVMSIYLHFICQSHVYISIYAFKFLD